MAQEDIKEVQSPEDIPQFSSEAEEAEFWATHSLGDWFLEQMNPMPEDALPSVRPETNPLSELLDDHTLGRLKELAYRRKVKPQILLTQLVVDRLDAEEEAGPASPTGEIRTPPAAKQGTKKKRNWLSEVHDFVRENRETIEDEELHFVVSANLLEESTTLLLELSNEIKAASAKKYYPRNQLQRMFKAYDKLKEFIDRAFAVHEEKFGLPEEETDNETVDEAMSSEESGELPIASNEGSEVNAREAGNDNITDITGILRARQRAESGVEQLRDETAT